VPADDWSPGRSGPFRSARSAPTAAAHLAGGRYAKRRRITRFSLASGQIVARSPAVRQQPGCEVELTEVHTHGQDWWTLGFEATGLASLLHSALEATAALVFAQALPGGVEPGLDDSRSYAEWLGQRPDADSDASA
jgi:hypothetical protein